MKQMAQAIPGRTVMAWFVFLLCSGCQVVPNEQGGRDLVPDPNAVAAVETGAEAGVGIIGMLSLIWPGLVPVAGIAAGILGTWRRMKPQVMAKTTEAESYYKAGEVLAASLEDIKKTQPDVWAKISPVIESALRPASAIEDTIRGFRHLPSKT